MRRLDMTNYNHYNHLHNNAYNYYNDYSDYSDYSDYNDYRDSDLDLDLDSQRFSDLMTQLTITNTLRNLNHDIEG